MASLFGLNPPQPGQPLESSGKIPELFYYTIVAPKIVRPDSNYFMNFTIHDETCKLTENIPVDVSIEDTIDPNIFKINRSVTMQPNVTETLIIPIDCISIVRNYKLVVKLPSIIKCHEANLNLHTQNHAILIQTDKPMYKPKDCIQFRVLVLDRNLKAAALNTNELSINIAVGHQKIILFY